MIFLSAGHSTVDPGALEFGTHGRKEADVVAELRNLVAFYLDRFSVPYQADGYGIENRPLSDTIKMKGQSAPALEFHCNSGPPLATGVETLSQPKDMALASRICGAISTTLGIRNRGAKHEGDGQHHRLAWVHAGGIIVELFFITNPGDLAAYEAKKWLVAKAIAEVLRREVVR